MQLPVDRPPASGRGTRNPQTPKLQQNPFWVRIKSSIVRQGITMGVGLSLFGAFDTVFDDFSL
jgi:hypothetical protein